MWDWPLVVRLGIACVWIALGAAGLGFLRYIDRELEPCIHFAGGAIGICDENAELFLVAGVAGFVACIFFLVGWLRRRS